FYSLRELSYQLHSYILYSPLHDENVSALIDRKPGRKLVPVFPDQNLDVRIASVFFVGRCQENDVAIQAKIGSLQGDKRRQICCQQDRKSTRLNSSHGSISYAVFCLKTK